MSYEEARSKRLAHIDKHLQFGFKVERDEANIVNGVGNGPACAMSLASHATAMALQSWFGKGDLSTMRQWWYTAARLRKFLYTTAPAEVGPMVQLLDLLNPLLSNEHAVTEWFSLQEPMLDEACVSSARDTEFLLFQSFLAIRGDWARLSQRSEQALKSGALVEKKIDYAFDFAFFAALAEGNLPAMRSALINITSPRQLSARNNFESGFTSGLISTMGVIYAKIAALHGFELDIQSPYIPCQWLSTSSSVDLSTPYRFLEDY